MGVDAVDKTLWPTHQPECFEAPIPGRQWYSGCDEARPRVNPATGFCENCGEEACVVCGRGNCPECFPRAAEDSPGDGS